MLSHYKISCINNNQSCEWKNLVAHKYYTTTVFYKNQSMYNSVYFTKEKFKGMISIYKYNDIKIIIPKNVISYHYHKYLIYLLSSPIENKKYLSVPERIFIELQYFKNYYEIIFKQGKYLIKNTFKIDDDNIKYLFYYDKLDVIYKIIQIFGNKYYADNNRIMILKKFCNEFGIEYEDIVDANLGNGIKIFIVTNLEYIEDQEYEGEMFFTGNSDFIFTKIGRYVLFL